ncbi:YopX family protein [Clostridium sp. YIM B02500]|uniref:YopX family protein n=1 Tax=Clostridium sp. YIM B02500 TaxID=2910681 RepID=UPI001EEDF33C|nr:YopX family protein [Clostridium sp. YIM B02500]
MREIKFRAKSSITNEWVYGGYYCMPDCRKDEDRHIVVYQDDMPGMQTKHEPVDINTLGQYTGVKDYKDNEIYEGDIVRFFNDVDYILKPGKVEVCFNLGAFCMKHFKYGTEPLRDMEIDDMFIKVIGNIYENPELLKELK